MAKKPGLIETGKRLLKVIRSDSWRNVLTGKGTNSDKRTSTTYGAGPRISDQTLANLYRSNGICRKIIDVPANDMTRNWMKITGDDDDEVLQHLETIKTKSRTNKGIKWSRLFGAGIVLMGIDDGGSLEEPVNEDNIRSVDSLVTFDRREVIIQEHDLQSDMSEPDFLEPQMYEITPVTGGDHMVRVHASRIMRFRGADLPRQELVQNAYWEQSIIQAIYEHMRQYGGVFDNAEFIIEDFIQTLIKMQNVMNHMKTQKGQELVKARLHLFDRSRSVANTMIIDTNEDYSKHASTVTGLDTLLDRFAIALAAVADMPVTKLYGRSPAGENATGESDMRNYNDGIKASQEDDVGPELEKLIKYTFLSFGKEPEKWTIKWQPLVTPTPKEEAELYDLTAKGDQTYVNARIADPVELEKHRFSGAEFNADAPTYEVKEPDPNETPPGEVPPEMLAAQNALIANAGKAPPGQPAVPPEGGDDDEGSTDDGDTDG
jgi:phage-related protein (TIGR01555 family)